MGKAYSKELKDKILDEYESGLYSAEELARKYGVTSDTICAWNRVKNIKHKSYKDIHIGDVFGDWTIIGEPYTIKTGKRNRYMALCQCACGNQAEMQVGKLLGGYSSRCKTCRSSSKIIIPIGKKFNRLTVLKKVENSTDKEIKVLCQCECGNTTIVRLRSIVSGNTQSCGCLQIEQASKPHPPTYYTHGDSYSPLYKVWTGMLYRCYAPSAANYSSYGGRGITVCDEWRNSYEKFKSWALANGYKEEFLSNGRNKWSIDRIDVNGNYCPENCRWTTAKEQARNKTTNKKIKCIETNIVYDTIADAVEQLNISREQIVYAAGKNKQKTAGGYHWEYVD